MLRKPSAEENSALAQMLELCFNIIILNQNPISLLRLSKYLSTPFTMPLAIRS
jgi:hypothetical protein